jgi:hypothetical protein
LIGRYLEDVTRQIKIELFQTYIGKVTKKGNKGIQDEQEHTNQGIKKADSEKRILEKFLNSIYNSQKLEPQKVATQIIASARIQPLFYLNWVRQILTQSLTRRIDRENLEKNAQLLEDYLDGVEPSRDYDSDSSDLANHKESK